MLASYLSRGYNGDVSRKKGKEIDAKIRVPISPYLIARNSFIGSFLKKKIGEGGRLILRAMQRDDRYLSPLIVRKNERLFPSFDFSSILETKSLFPFLSILLSREKRRERGANTRA